MEHCIIDIPDMGTAMTMSGGKLFIGSNGNRVKTPVYCVIPELGITYPIVDAGIYSDITPTADGITFNETSTDIHKITGYITDENGIPIKEVDRCTYLAVDLQEAKCYGEIVLSVEYDPFREKTKNNYVEGCWQVRVYEPIQLSNVKLLSEG